MPRLSGILPAVGFVVGAALFAGEGAKCERECAGKDGSKCCVEGKVIALTAEKAILIAEKIRAESCCEKSGAILAEALSGLKCETTLAKLIGEIKAPGCSKSGSTVILAAAKELATKETCEKGKALTSAVCADKALALAKQIRAEACATKSSEILAAALPGLKCETALAKLVSDIKANECEKAASEAILATAKELAAKGAKTEVKAPAANKTF